MTDKNKRLLIIVFGIIIYILIFLYDYDSGQIRLNITESSFFYTLENLIEREVTRGPDEIFTWII